MQKIKKYTIILLIIPVTLTTTSGEQVGESSPTPPTFQNSTNVSNVPWPDYRCLPGWPDYNITASVFAQIRQNCSNVSTSLRNSSEEPSNCEKICILEGMKLVERRRRYDSNGKLYYVYVLSKLSNFETGIKTIISDEQTISKIRTNVFPRMKASYWWVLAKPCTDKIWDDFIEDFDQLLRNISNGNCLVNLGIQYDEHLTHPNISVYKSRHVRLTANLDLSCYSDFEYRGIGRDEGSMEVFEDWDQDCKGLFTEAGIKKICFQPCILERMGIFYFDTSSGTYTPHLHSKELMTSNFQFFTGPNAIETAGKLAELIIQNCSSTLNLVKMESCAQWGVFEDCIERVMSCNYTGMFLRKKTLPKGTTPSLFPDLTCRTGYVMTKKGSSLLNSYKANCSVDFPNGTNPKLFRECMLGQMGIIRLRGVQQQGQEYTAKNSPVLISMVDIKANMSKILTGRGGSDTSAYIAAKIYSSCLPLYEAAKDADSEANTDWWGELYSCIRKTMDCRGAIFLKPDVALTNNDDHQDDDDEDDD